MPPESACIESAYSIRVYRREGERFGRPIELSREAGDVLTTTLLPGLEIALPDVIRE